MTCGNLVVFYSVYIQMRRIKQIYNQPTVQKCKGNQKLSQRKRTVSAQPTVQNVNARVQHQDRYYKIHNHVIVSWQDICVSV